MEKFEDILQNVETMLATERPRLLRLCTRITGSTLVAEDMVQEALLVAWRHLDDLREPEKFAPWLNGIARNVCLRWVSRQARDTAQSLELPLRHEDGMASLAETLADEMDVEIEMERQELAELLDRALDLLPTETRMTLLERYVRESSLSEIATLMGMNVNAVSMRLQRGRLALRKVLASQLQLESEDYTPVEDDSWEQTSLWCYLCGQHRLLGKLKPDQLELHLKCPGCCPERGDFISTNSGFRQIRGIKGYKPAVTRMNNWANYYYRTALNTGSVPCCECGHPVALNFGLPDTAASWMRQRATPVINLFCGHCQSRSYSSLEHLALSLPALNQFRRQHPRIRTLPSRFIEAQGGRAMVSSYESVTSAARVDVVTSLENFQTLRIGGQV
ncbi:RNA polymerase sigma factor [Dictyobacter aurantiacus]|uniref:RNA polymerase sigma factor n=1 Tax=Dictyobacter aurantiacus TaxID=1936993 RepID=A0A401ZJV7_9CHLR|nr:RNA polymerase sigma factor [Dictyobacter aurantiacus]GCE07136.1 hypothetical protein KDAU_44650 [Dictyobacter aurantiacus]